MQIKSIGYKICLSPQVHFLLGHVGIMWEFRKTYPKTIISPLSFQ